VRKGSYLCILGLGYIIVALAIFALINSFFPLPFFGQYSKKISAVTVLLGFIFLVRLRPLLEDFRKSGTDHRQNKGVSTL
jgi:hypothetical protein